MHPDKFKLLLKKAIFTGEAFLKHTDNIQNEIDGVMDESLIELFENDQEAFELLERWEKIRESLIELSQE